MQPHGDGGTDAVGDGGDAAALVVVGPAEEEQRALVADLVRADLAAVALDGGRREAGQVGDRELGLGRTERLCGGGPAGAHHERDIVGFGAGQLAQAGGCGVGGGEGVGNRCVHADERSR